MRAEKFHKQLSMYFFQKAKGVEKGSEWKTNHRRGFSEVIWQLVKSRDLKTAKELLSSFSFLINKINSELLEDVFNNFLLINDNAPREIIKELEIWIAFFREKAHILRRGNENWPAYKIFLQLAVEHADNSYLTIQAEKWLQEGKCNWVWLKRINRLKEVPISPCIAVFEGHTEKVHGAVQKSDGNIVSWSLDRTIRIWNIRGKEINVLRGHDSYIKLFIDSKDGDIISWSGKIIIVYDKFGKILGVLKGHSGYIRGALKMKRGNILSWDHDYSTKGNCTLIIWNENYKISKISKISKIHPSGIEGAMELSNGNIITWSIGKLIFWDKRGKILRIIKRKFQYYGALETREGYVLTWGRPNGATVWKSNGKKIKELGENVFSWMNVTTKKESYEFSWKRYKKLRIWDNNGHVINYSGLDYFNFCSILKLKGGDLLIRSHYITLIVLNEWGEELVVLHEQAIIKSMFETSDGQIVWWSDDYSLRIWNRKRKVISVLKGHTSHILGVIETKECNIVSWSFDNTIRIWNPRGKAISVLKGHTSRIKNVILTKEGNIVSWSDDNMLRIWNPRGQVISVLKGHSSYIAGATQSEDGSIISWSGDYTIRIWDKKGKELSVLEGHSSHIERVIVTKKGNIVSWSNDHTTRFWTQKGEALCVLMDTSRIEGAFQTNEGNIISWSTESTLKMWNQSGDEMCILKGHTSSVLGVMLTKKGNIVSWSDDKTIRIWNQDGKELSVLHGNTEAIYRVVETENGNILSWTHGGPGGETIIIYNQSGEKLLVIKALDSRLEKVIETINGNIVALTGDSTIRIWNKNGEEISELGYRKDWGTLEGRMNLNDGSILSRKGIRADILVLDKNKNLVNTLVGHTERIRGYLETSDNKILSWSDDHTLRLWDKDIKESKILDGHRRHVVKLIETKEGDFISSGRDAVRIWDKNGQQIKSLENNEDCNLLILPSGNIIAYLGNIHVWDSNGKLKAIFEDRHLSGVNGVTELKNGNILSWGNASRGYCGGEDQKILMHNHEGKLIKTFEGNYLNCGALEIRNGNLFTWGDKGLFLWDKNGVLIKRIERHYLNANNVLIMNDGNILVYSSAETTLRIYNEKGTILNVLSGHTNEIKGAIILRSGEILSWSYDNQIIKWRSDFSTHITFCECKEPIDAVVELLDKELLTWCINSNFQLWNQNVEYQKRISVFEAVNNLPEARYLIFGRERCYSNSYFISGHSTENKFCSLNSPISGNSSQEIRWHGETTCSPWILKGNGRAILTEDNGQVCFLQLYYGNRRITIKELENLRIKCYSTC